MSSASTSSLGGLGFVDFPPKKKEHHLTSVSLKAGQDLLCQQAAEQPMDLGLTRCATSQ